MYNPHAQHTHVIVTVAYDGISFRQPPRVTLLTHSELVWLTHASYFGGTIKHKS